jgi:hypothetical protein
MTLVNDPPVLLLPLLASPTNFNPTAPILAGSTISYLDRLGAISYILSLSAWISSYGKGLPKYSLKARIICQSSLATPGGGTAARVFCVRPSRLTYVADFSVYAAPGRMTSAYCAPRSP